MGKRKVFIKVDEGESAVTCQIVGELEELMADIGMLMKERLEIRLLMLATVGAYLYHNKNPAHIIFQQMVSDIYKEIGSGGRGGIIIFNQN